MPFSFQDGLNDLKQDEVIISGFAERLWAYLTIKDLLRKKLIIGDSELLYNEALKLALQYKLVTPVTSLIIKEANPPGELANEYYGRDTNFKYCCGNGIKLTSSLAMVITLLCVYWFQ